MNGQTADIRCPLCGGSKHSPAKYRLARCDDCGLIHAAGGAPARDSSEQYTARYYAERTGAGKSGSGNEIERTTRSFSKRAEKLVRDFGPGGRLLDVGCGQGFFIACMKRCGWDAVGVDVSPWAVRFAREALGLTAYEGSVENVPPGERFDVVTMFHVLEHLRRPVQALEQAAEHLEDGGTLIIEGPNYAGFDRLWHGELWRGFTDPSHLSFFTPATYRLAIERAGLSVGRIDFQTWDPAFHLLGAGILPGARSEPDGDTAGRIRRKMRSNIFVRGVCKILYSISRGLHLRGRDARIYARRKDAA